MGIFGNDKKKEEKKDAPKKEVANKDEKKAITETGVVPAHILKKPHISEKALLAGAHDVYVFETYKGATAPDVKRAVEEAYNVEVVAVNMAKVPGKTSSRRMKGKRGTKSGVKKAYVTLKKGSKIQLI